MASVYFTQKLMCQMIPQLHPIYYIGNYSWFFRFPNLVGFGTLTPQYAASKVIDAIEKNQIHLTMPRGAYLSTAIQQ